jgi:hypothetical protein
MHSHTEHIHSAHGRKENHRAYHHDPALAEIVVDTVLDVHQEQCFDNELSSLGRDATIKHFSYGQIGRLSKTADTRLTDRIDVLKWIKETNVSIERP